ncbi:MAG: hypothetical protein GY765_14985 [bacterium]|nr:hypothetical protein [bacterium]
MNYALCIKSVDASGRFHSPEWEGFLDFISSRSNSLLIYSPKTFEEMRVLFQDTCELGEEEFPDKSLNYHSYRLTVRHHAFWKKLQAADFDFSFGISHTYFLIKEKCFASLETTDHVNWIMIFDICKESICEKYEILPTSDAQYENRKYELDEFSDNEPWEIIVPRQKNWGFDKVPIKKGS